jgi:hypothetical protein
MQDLLSTEYIMERYSMKRQAAAKLMYNMPVIKIGKRIFVRARDLENWEQQKTVYPVVTPIRSRKVVRLERKRAT